MTIKGTLMLDSGEARNPWWAVGTIAAGTFLLVTTEFLPIGMLSRLARDLKVSEGLAGLAVTAPGLIAAGIAPALLLLAGRVDRKVVVLVLTSAIVASNVVAATALTFCQFLVGRVLLGFAVGGLWTFAGAVGRRLVPEVAGARATVFISAGISVGTVFGMPVGAIMSDLAGWHVTFAANATVGIAIVAAQARLVPRMPSATSFSLSDSVKFVKIPMARTGLIASGIVAAGHFVAYTFLEPYLQDALGLRRAGLAGALAGYAFAGIVGSFIGERLAARNTRQAFAVTSLVLAISVVMAAATKGAPPVAIGMVLIWGVAFGALPVCVQIWIFNSSPKLYEVGSAMMVSSFQAALAAGAAVGGVVVDHEGTSIAFLAAAALLFSGALVALFSAPSLPSS
jgi:predicted MFS family arabinose efflux permease